MTAETQGKRVYEVWRAAIPDVVCNVPGGAWEELPATVQAGFNAIAAQDARPAPDTDVALASLAEITEEEKRMTGA